MRHLVIGDDQHGVVRHGVLVARSCGHELVRAAHPGDVQPQSVSGADVVHIPFTDRLFGMTCEQAQAAFLTVAAMVRAQGAAVSVTLHDIPRGTDALSRRRRAAYRAVIGVARGVVVNSGVELDAVQDDAVGVHALSMIDLPVQPVPSSRTDPADRDVVVLGFVFPDRGHAEVIRALPPGSGLRALGATSAGHGELAASLAELAARCGRGWQLTGFVPDDALPPLLAGAAVPVAPNVHVAASASIATWLAHGRRPIVPDTAYTRELLERMPGALTRYDPADPGALAGAITRALADPSGTWLDDGVTVGPAVDAVARDYRRHLDSCAPARGVVPGNRWDLVSGRVAESVSVVIPYYDAQRRLDLVLAGLRARTAAAALQVVVADDGSPRPPDLSAAGDLDVTVVRQEHRGFGAGRARNLGAAAATGQVVAFLDGDTVPEPEYLDRLVRLPAGDPAVLAIGRRRHADLSGWTAADVGDWFAHRRAGPPELASPAWLGDAYRATRDLLDSDARSYRFVISAVLAVHRDLFARIGGFDERFTAYGGEDWEFAHRAWLAGALFAHVPAAVAWHDGPDWAGRGDAPDLAGKNVETAALARLLPDPGLRGAGQWFPYCHAIVRLHATDPAGVLATVRSAFAAGVDCQFWLTGDAGRRIAEHLGDPRVHAGEPAADVRARAAVVVEVPAPADLADLGRLAALAADRGIVRTPGLTARSTRALARCGPEDRLLAQAFGAHTCSSARPLGRVDLAADLPCSGQPVRRS